jgi:hypothetical protein
MDQNTSACMWPVTGVLMVDLVIEIITLPVSHDHDEWVPSALGREARGVRGLKSFTGRFWICG